MEFDVLEILLRHREDVAGIGEEDIPVVFILRHILILTLLEILQFSRIVAFYPAGLMQMHRLPATLGVVFVLKTILYHLKLQLSHSTDDATAVELIDKQLGNTFVHELLETLLELLRLHRVIVLDVFEHLRREGRQSAEVQLLPLGQGITDFEDAVVGQSHDIACPCLVDGLLALGHELGRRGETQRLVLPHMEVRLIAYELAGAYLTEMKPVNFGSSGFTMRSTAFVGRGDGAISTKQSSSSCTPKLFSAEPKKTGAKMPSR